MELEEKVKELIKWYMDTYGNLGESGNRSIDLVDSKLYTRNSKCVEVDESLNQIFIDLVLDHFKTLWDNDLITDDIESFNREIMLDNINTKFAINYPEQSAKLKEETGGYFTLDDLDCIKVKFEIEKPIGDLGKSGNKVINLVDSKLYTKNSKCVEIDENLNQIFIDLVLEHLQSLWDNDMIDSNFSFSRDVLLEQINDKFTERYPEQSARLREETGGYFTLDDLDCIKVKFEIEKPVGDLANKINFDLLNTFFNHQHEMTRSSSVNKTTMKNILNDGRDISIAKLVENTSLIIK